MNKLFILLSNMQMFNMSIWIASCDDVDAVNEANGVVYCVIGAVIDDIGDLMVLLYIFNMCHICEKIRNFSWKILHALLDAFYTLQKFKISKNKNNSEVQNIILNLIPRHLSEKRQI